MKLSVIETVSGPLVLMIAVIFPVYSYDTFNAGDVNGYAHQVRFNSVGVQDGAVGNESNSPLLP